jgi:hypothetical protein
MPCAWALGREGAQAFCDRADALRPCATVDDRKVTEDVAAAGSRLSL